MGTQDSGTRTLGLLMLHESPCWILSMMKVFRARFKKIAFSFFEFSVTFSSSFSSCVSSLLPANLFLLGPDHLNHSVFFLAKTILASRCNWRNFLQLLQKPLFTVSMASKTSLYGFVRFQKRKIRVKCWYFEPGPFIPREWAHRSHRCYL